LGEVEIPLLTLMTTMPQDQWYDIKEAVSIHAFREGTGKIRLKASYSGSMYMTQKKIELTTFSACSSATCSPATRRKFPASAISV